MLNLVVHIEVVSEQNNKIIILIIIRRRRMRRIIVIIVLIIKFAFWLNNGNLKYNYKQFSILERNEIQI